jgi:ATP phosphoribosyltransferase
MSLKIALPKGRLLAQTAALLNMAGWGLDGYHERARSYRLKSQRFPNLLIKVFQERDIPIQVAVGNYDLGICGLDWIEELLARYPSSALVKVKDLGYGEGSLYAAVANSNSATSVESLAKNWDAIRIASEYPNLAESFAERLRLRRFSIYPLWGAAEVYPPESADLILVPSKSDRELSAHGLALMGKVLEFGAYLIANENSLKSKDMTQVLAAIMDKQPPAEELSSLAYAGGVSLVTGIHTFREVNGDVVRLALPDGHQQSHVRRILDRAGIQIEDYPSAVGNRRPVSHWDKVIIKVIRPQDMPLQVANGNFDLAITGRDWLTEHLEQFPSSPVTELLDLKYGRVRIVAVVSQNVAADDIDGLRQVCSQNRLPYRVASEYVNIADRYARVNRLGMYRVIPTWGASEAFLPEDADLLIENTETGGTIARHNLKIIDTLFESTACLIGGTIGICSSVKRERITSIVETLRYAVGGS